MDAGNIELLNVSLLVGVPHDWIKRTHRYSAAESDEKWYYFCSAVQGACDWDRPDVLKYLVLYFLKERYDNKKKCLCS